MHVLSEALECLAAGRSLTSAQTHRAVGALIDGEATESAAEAFLTALHEKGETADELEGAVRAVRDRMTPWDCGLAGEKLLDTCGTGGDGAGTINISTAAALVAAACGVRVVKHGNRAATSKAGSSDVLAALGVAHDPDPDVSRRCLAELSIAFLFAPRFHPGLARLAPLRRRLPFRTIFNLVGPLCNPAGPSHQLIGVPNDTHAGLLADVLRRQAHVRRAVVVTGADGLDEITLDGPTAVRLVETGRVEHTQWGPNDFGLSRHGADALVIRDARESAARLHRLFEGERGPARDYVLANSSAALWVTGRCTLLEGTALAAEAIDSGAAARLLKRLRELAPAPDPCAAGEGRDRMTCPLTLRIPFDPQVFVDRVPARFHPQGQVGAVGSMVRVFNVKPQADHIGLRPGQVADVPIERAENPLAAIGLGDVDAL